MNIECAAQRRQLNRSTCWWLKRSGLESDKETRIGVHEKVNALASNYVCPPLLSSLPSLRNTVSLHFQYDPSPCEYRILTASISSGTLFSNYVFSLAIFTPILLFMSFLLIMTKSSLSIATLP